MAQEQYSIHDKRALLRIFLGGMLGAVGLYFFMFVGFDAGATITSRRPFSDIDLFALVVSAVIAGVVAVVYIFVIYLLEHDVKYSVKYMCLAIIVGLCWQPIFSGFSSWGDKIQEEVEMKALNGIGKDVKSIAGDLKQKELVDVALKEIDASTERLVQIAKNSDSLKVKRAALNTLNIVKSIVADNQSIIEPYITANKSDNFSQYLSFSDKTRVLTSEVAGHDVGVRKAINNQPEAVAIELDMTKRELALARESLAAFRSERVHFQARKIELEETKRELAYARAAMDRKLASMDDTRMRCRPE